LPEYQERWGNKGPYPGEPEKSAPPSDTYNPPEPNIGGSLSLPDHDATPVNELPDGWTAADIHLLLKKLEKGPILVADYRLGIPTIHDNFGAETRHLGFGFMQVDGDGYTLRFDAGGAMQRTPSGNGWTKLIIEGQYQGYDINSVGQKLMSWLPSKFKRANNPLDQYSPVL
jgi:hypothetical protein